MKGQSQSVGIGNLFGDIHTNGKNIMALNNTLKQNTRTSLGSLPTAKMGLLIRKALLLSSSTQMCLSRAQKTNPYNSPAASVFTSHFPSSAQFCEASEALWTCVILISKNGQLERPPLFQVQDQGRTGHASLHPQREAGSTEKTLRGKISNAPDYIYMKR